MPKPPASPLPTSITSGQLARLIDRTERVINGRKAHGRLPAAPDGGVDLARLVQAGVAALARQDRRDAEQVDREACNLARFAVECAVSAMAEPRQGEDGPTAAARGLAAALSEDDYFDRPADWPMPTRIEADSSLLMTEAEEAALR